MALQGVFGKRNPHDIASLRSKYGRFLIYGAGNTGRDLARIMAGAGLNVAGFIDANAAAIGQADGLPVATIERAKQAKKPMTCVVLALFNPYADSCRVKEDLIAAGFPDVLSFYEIYDLFAAGLGNRFFMADRAYYDARSEAIIKGAEIWADERSRSLYEQVVRFRYTGDLSLSPKPDRLKDQYFPPDVPGWGLPKRFVDCGAYDGDTLKEVHARAGRLEAAAAFEPDEANFVKLKKAADEVGFADDMRLFKRGVFSSERQLKFSAEKGSGSRIEGTGEVVIEVVSLDGAIPDLRPDMIKMDIEGAEEEALKGAVNLIKGTKPRLAVSVYHRPEDIWNLPALIASWGLGYSFYLRPFAPQTFELVLFAV